MITQDALRSLAISQRLLGARQVMLDHHTDCGVLTSTDQDPRDAIAADTGVRPS